MNPEHLTELQVDAVRELGSIGAGHAATALSQLAGCPVGITVPEASVVAVTRMPQLFGGPEALVGAVLSRLLGDVRGSVLFVAPRASFVALQELMGEAQSAAFVPGTPEAQGLAPQAGSLLIAAYVSAIAQMTGVVMIAAPPAFAFDMLGAILDTVASEVGMRADVALLVLTTLTVAGAPIEGAVLFLPEADGLERMLDSLGVA